MNAQYIECIFYWEKRLNAHFTEKKWMPNTERKKWMYILLRKKNWMYILRRKTIECIFHWEKKLNAHLAEKKFFGLNTTTVDSLLFVGDKRDFTIKKINQIYNICACFDFMSSNLKVGCLSATLISWIYILNRIIQTIHFRTWSVIQIHCSMLCLLWGKYMYFFYHTLSNYIMI